MNTFKDCQHKANDIIHILKSMFIYDKYCDEMMLGELLISTGPTNSSSTDTFYYTIKSPTYKLFCISLGSFACVRMKKYHVPNTDSVCVNFTSRHDMSCSKTFKEQMLVTGLDIKSEMHELIFTEEEYFMRSTIDVPEVVDVLTVASLVKRFCIDNDVDLLDFGITEMLTKKEEIFSHIAFIKNLMGIKE